MQKKKKKLHPSPKFVKEPGLDCRNWYPFIEAHHYRVQGRSHLRNGLYTADNTDNFRFGTSTSVSPDDVVSTNKSVMDVPFDTLLPAAMSTGVDSGVEGASEVVG